MDQKQENNLKNWFVAHFVIDFVFAIPLLIFPTEIGQLLGFSITETLFPRLVAAALIGIGGVSYYARKHSKGSYDSLLTMKIFWSIGAIIAIIMTLIEKQLLVLWVLLAIFIIFNIIWVYYKLQLKHKK